MKRRIGDRKDGYRLRHADPFFRIIPYIMREKNDAHVFFEDRIYLENTDKFIRKLRKEGLRIGFLHIVIASMVRTISQKPKINRFVIGRKTYARNEISFSLAVKKEMSEETEETTIKIIFEPTDTIYDVVEKVNNEIQLNKGVSDDNSTDKAAKLIAFMPGFLIGFFMFLVKHLDNIGHLPKFLIDLSPFHSSIFVTDLGSIGIKSIYHHIYNLGTNTLFIAFGTKTKEQVIDLDNNVKIRKAIDIKTTVDERIVDGYYFANAIRLAKHYMTHPEELVDPPKEVIIDNEI
ncbi:MAG: 2-oxo acid dehydrogenase subunit E2 [Candidatus Izimaplasma sp.]|nr:2-oxo acid dehydrogenase subunit E2 [Candidatus Izimaplasma bacterium]